MKNILYLYKVLLYAIILYSMVFDYVFEQAAVAIDFNVDVQTTTQAIILYNLDTGTVVFEKNGDQKMFPASITKIMTYIIVTQQVQDLENTQITVSKSVVNSLLGTGSSLAGFKAGETYTAKQILNGMMVSSGNECALILAYHVSEGNIEHFVDMMNEMAIKLGCTNTHFSNPHGLHDEQHYTTAKDVQKIVEAARTAPDFTEITSQSTSHILGNERYPLVTTNLMIDKHRGGKYYYPYAKWGKTGYTDEAGHCIVVSAKKENHNYLCIALGDFGRENNSAMLDAKNLFEWAFSNLKIKTVAGRATPMGETHLNFAWQKDRLQLALTEDYFALLPKSVDASSVDIILDVPKEVNAPVSEGDKIGKATLRYANQVLTEIDVVAAETVDRSQWLFFFHAFKRVAFSLWFILASIFVILLVSAYIIAVRVNNKNRRGRYVRR